MATRHVTRSLLTTTKQSISSFHRSFATASLSTPSVAFLPLRPLVAIAAANYRQALSSWGTGVRCFSTRRTSSSLNDPNPNWSNRPPKETILLDGCDFEHWLVVVEKPEGDPTRDEIIDSYIKTLATVVGSEEEARMKIYSVSTRHYYAFGALVNEELSYKLKEKEKVRWVLPDSYLDVRNKDYGGEPFINGQAVPYDPKYHEEWVRNNARANERNRRNDRPRNFDRSRNFERRREGQPNGGPPGGPNSPPNNMSGPPNNGNNAPNYVSGPPNNGNNSPNYVSGPPNNGNNAPNYVSGPPNAPPNNFSRPPNMSGPPYPNMGPNMSGPPPNMRGMQGNNMGQPSANYNPGGPPGNYNARPYNAGPPGNAPPTYQHGNAPSNNGMQYQQYQPAPGQQQNNYAPNPPNAYPSYNNQNQPGRDMPPFSDAQ